MKLKRKKEIEKENKRLIKVSRTVGQVMPLYIIANMQVTALIFHWALGNPAFDNMFLFLISGLHRLVSKFIFLFLDKVMMLSRPPAKALARQVFRMSKQKYLQKFGCH